MKSLGLVVLSAVALLPTHSFHQQSSLNEETLIVERKAEMWRDSISMDREQHSFVARLPRSGVAVIQSSVGSREGVGSDDDLLRCTAFSEAISIHTHPAEFDPAPPSVIDMMLMTKLSQKLEPAFSMLVLNVKGEWRVIPNRQHEAQRIIAAVKGVFAMTSLFSVEPKEVEEMVIALVSSPGMTAEKFTRSMHTNPTLALVMERVHKKMKAHKRLSLYADDPFALFVFASFYALEETNQQLVRTPVPESFALYQSLGKQIGYTITYTKVDRNS